ncbi:conserved hypothetical protein [Parafrankia sp. Ea1.12]|nr:conserved hypothetical protein [Parafrankia sp. Ea1.12]
MLVGSQCDLDLIDVSDFASMLGVSRSRADMLTRYAGFPTPAVVKPRIRLWHRRDVESWCDRNRPGWRGDS